MTEGWERRMRSKRQVWEYTDYNGMRAADSTSGNVSRGSKVVTAFGTGMSCRYCELGIQERGVDWGTRW